MNIMISIKLALSNLLRNKKRTSLAVISISIGIIALIVLVSLSYGIYNDYAKTINQIKGILVFSKTVPDPSRDKISLDLLPKLKTIHGIKKIVPEIYHIATNIEGKKLEINMSNLLFVYGVSANNLLDGSYSSILKNNLIKGRLFKENEKQVILIPKEVADDYHKTIGQKINIDKQEYKIIGIFYVENKLMGSPIFANINDLKENYNYGKDKVNAFLVIPENIKDSRKISKQIEFKIDSVQAQDKEDMQKQLGDLLNILELLAIFVSIIASFVAAIGVINTVLMSVIERFKEIGTLKAVGWSKEDILIMILLESILIGFLGSILGIILGVSFSLLINIFTSLSINITLSLILKTFIFGVVIGIISGIYPAYVASKLNPIDALRS